MSLRPLKKAWERFSMMSRTERLSAMDAAQLQDEINDAIEGMWYARNRYGDNAANTGIFIQARADYFQARRVLNAR